MKTDALSPIFVGKRALASREDLRKVASLANTLQLAGKILDARDHEHPPEWVHDDSQLANLLTVCELAARELADTVYFVVGEFDTEESRERQT